MPVKKARRDKVQVDSLQHARSTPDSKDYALCMGNVKSSSTYRRPHEGRIEHYGIRSSSSEGRRAETNSSDTEEGRVDCLVQVKYGAMDIHRFHY